MQEEMSFIDNDGNNKIIAPSVGFVNNEYGDVSNYSFNLAFKEEAEIEK